MQSHIQQVKSIDENGTNVTTTRTEQTKNSTTDESVGSSVLVSRFVWYLVGVIDTILGLRFILILFGASTANAFVNLIYNISYPLAAPFFGIFGYNLRYGVSRVEVSTLFAILVYSLIAFGITRLLTIGSRQRDGETT